MKIKLDFVTNSSSACFLVSVPREQEGEFEDYCNELNQHEDAGNEGVACYIIGNTVKEVQEFTNDGPLDWASRPGGPRFYRLSEEQYKLCVECLKVNHTVYEASVDYNVCDEFTNDWQEEIMEYI